MSYTNKNRRVEMRKIAMLADWYHASAYLSRVGIEVGRIGGSGDHSLTKPLSVMVIEISWNDPQINPT